MEYSPPGSSVHEISLARTLEWVSISFSRGSSRPRDQTCFSCSGRWILYLSAIKEAHSGYRKSRRKSCLNVPFFIKSELPKSLAAINTPLMESSVGWQLTLNTEIFWENCVNEPSQDLPYFLPEALPLLQFTLIKLQFPALQEDSLPSEPPGKPI